MNDTDSKLATLNYAISGKLSRWRKGQKVRARRDGTGLFTIERRRWNGLLTCQNVCGGVPREALTFL